MNWLPPRAGLLATRIATARHRIARHRHGGRGRFGLAALDFVSAAGVECAGVGRAGTLVLARHPARGPAARPTSRPGWEGLVFWLLALEWLTLARPGRLDRLGRHVPGLFLVVAAVPGRRPPGRLSLANSRS